MVTTLNIQPTVFFLLTVCLAESRHVLISFHSRVRGCYKGNVVAQQLNILQFLGVACPAILLCNGNYLWHLCLARVDLS